MESSTRNKIIIKLAFASILVFASGCINYTIAQNYEDSLTLQLQKHFEASQLPGFGVSIVTEDGTQYQKGFGYADKKNKVPFTNLTVQNLGSVSKTAVGLALVKVIEEGSLSLDAEINDYLPFKVENPYFKDTPILVRHLAEHTSSILDTKNYRNTYIPANYEYDHTNIHEGYLNFIQGHEVLTMQDFLYKILDSNGGWYKKKNFLKAAPGTQREYSNINAALAALIIENVTKDHFKEYTKEKIFDPLQMYSTTWSIEDISQENIATTYFPSGYIVPKYSLITYPDGGLFSSISDLNLYLIEIIKAYSGDSEYLSPEMANILLPGDNDNDRAFWGMGVTSRNIGHSGSDPGVQADLRFNADTKIGWIIISNVNAEDNELLWKQYKEIHSLLAKYELKLSKQ